VVRLEPVLESASGFPLVEEGEMFEEPSQVGEDTIHGWQAPYLEG
jgi:hypothetical protein